MISSALRKGVLPWLCLFTAVGLLWGCERGEEPYAEDPVVQRGKAAPAEYAGGEALFNRECAPCHGAGGSGSPQGPPLVHKIYEPGHHGDFSFHRAVRQGVLAHHWGYGNMPRITGLQDGQVEEIIAYVRWLQREAGIL